MNFNFPLLKTVRILLFPFSLLYFVVIILRNRLYDYGILKSASFNLPLICIGNVAAGGTGKSPMTEYLVKELRGQFKIATLSRGYKRKTRGYALANENSTALDIGDEPMQFHLKFPEIPVAVGEERIEAIPQLLHDQPTTQAILLDDAFQHRSVKAGLNIVLTDCSNLYTRDWYLPTGDLRDERKSVQRAQLIIVTKCPPDLPITEKEAIIEELNPLPGQAIFFTSIRYGQPYHIISKTSGQVSGGVEVLLVTGIANPGSLKNLLQEKSKAYYEIAYNDHHIFTIDDLKDIQKRFSSITAKEKIILTTEKDAVRLMKFEQELAAMPLYVVPIELAFLFNDAARFNGLIGNFIKDFNKSPKG